jgi:hypothetical protein
MPSIVSATKSVPLLAFLAAAIAITGCGTTKVSNESKADAAPRAPGAPSMIYVTNFDLGAATVKSDPGTLTGRPRLIHFGETDPAKKLEELSDLLAKSLVEDLNKQGLPAKRLSADAARPKEGWLVKGAFLEVAEGNRMQKAVVGFGAGQSDAHLYVAVDDLGRPAGQQDLLDFDVHSQGDTTPGGAGETVITHTPYGMGAKFALERNASEADIKRAAQRIADGLEKLAQKREAK